MKPSVPPRSCGALVAVLMLWVGTSSLPAYFAPDSFFDVFIENSSAPPYPPATGVAANIGAPVVPFVPIASTSLKLNSVSGSPTTVVSGSDSGGGPGDAGLYSFFDIYLENPMMISSFFDIFTEMSLAGGAPLAIADTPTVVWHVDSFFDVFFECDIPGQGRQAVKMAFRIPAGQTAQFAAPPTIGNSQPGVNSFFDIFLNVTSPAGINPQLPVVRVIMTGSLGWPQPWTVPSNVTKFRQNPDPSIRGLDVLDSWRTNAGPATLLADDFICTRTGPVTDIHIWGSWLNDLVDHWPTFWVGIWSDVPRSNNVPSHPGELLWSQQFSPGEYRASVQQTVPQELFLDPNAPPTIIGQDHQIWKYDFFPRTPFRQLGSPQLPKVYWLSVVTKTAPGRVFGWKTTTDHYNDFAVYAPTTLTFGPGYPMPQSPWQVIVDPQGRQRELSFMLTTSQRWACNKDFWNPWPYALNNVRVVLPGPWGLSGHFNGMSGGPQFSTFTWDWNSTGQTLMDWSGGVVSPGQWVHIGFEGPGEFPPFLNWGWWNPFVGNWWGWIPQFGIGWQGLLLPAPIINFTNILPIVPSPTNNLFLSSLTVEYYTNEVALESLNRSTPRSPIRVDAGVAIPSPLVVAGGQTAVPLPPRPPEATHAVVIPTISPVNELGQPNPQWASVDWAMIPLTQELPPTPPAAPVLQVPQVAAGSVTLTWSAEPGAIYRVQTRTSLTGDMWTDVEGDEIAGGATASKVVQVNGQTSFYRVLGLTP